MIQRIQTLWMALTAILVGIVWWVVDGTLWFTLLCIASALASVVAIFLFRNRARQLSLLYAGFLLLVAIVAFAIYYCWFAAKTAPYAPPVAFLTLMTNYMAIRGIMRDEVLIRSSDRLR